MMSPLGDLGARLTRWPVALLTHRRRSSDVGGGGPWNTGSDVRFALRSICASPWYATTVVGVIGTAIAIATTAFAIVDGVLFRPLPYPTPSQLVAIEPGFQALPPSAARRLAVSEVDLRNWQAAAPDVPMTAFIAQPWNGLGAGVNESAAGVAQVQPNFFDVIGVRPLIGGFLPADFVDQARIRPALITHQVWTSQFNGDPDVIGREIITDRALGVGVRVVGVMPKGFVFPSSQTDVKFLAPLVPSPTSRNDPRARNLPEVVARLPEGLTPSLLGDRLARGLAATAAAFPPIGPRPSGWSDAGWRRQGPYDSVTINTLAISLGRGSRPLFQAIFAAVLLLVTLAAANVSGVMTARAVERLREVEVRRALGAGPWAIARLWLLEAGSLVWLGGALGGAASLPLLDRFTGLMPEDIVLLTPARLDWRVAGFTAGMLTLLSLVVAAAPIRRSLGRRTLAPDDTLARSVSRRVRTPGRILLVASQVGLAFSLTVVGASLVGSLLSVYSNTLPIRTDGVVVLDVMFQGPGATMSVSAVRTERERLLRERLAQLPGVKTVGSTAAQVLRGGGEMSWFVPPAGRTRPANLDTWPVTGGFYNTLEPQLVAGRLPSPQELRTSAPLIVVSESVARAYWPDRSALGQQLSDDQSMETFTVIGVVKDVRWLAWDVETPVIYAPYERVGRAPWITYFVRTDAVAGRVIADALRAIEEVDPKTSVSRAAPLTEVFRDSVKMRRFQSWLFGGLATAALVVVGVGILGLMAMSAATRTREVGIRCALGATPAGVLGLLLREQFLAVGVGLFVGGIGAFWAVGFVKGYLYEVSTTDPRVWGTSVMLILTMTAMGTLVPAVRASRVDPLTALRSD